jgi:hypothetical protein
VVPHTLAALASIPPAKEQGVSFRMKRKIEFNIGRATTPDEVRELTDHGRRWVEFIHASIGLGEPTPPGEVAEIVERLRHAVTDEFVDMTTGLPTLPVDLVGLSGELTPED